MTVALQGRLDTATAPEMERELKESIDAGDLDAAFEAAHALKGVTGNLGLTPIRKPVLEITELLRARTEMDYSELVEEIEKQKDILTKLAE